jgi:hypothetical protein
MMDYTREQAIEVITAAHSSCGEILRTLNEVNKDCDLVGAAMLDPEPLRSSSMSLGRSLASLEDGASIDDISEDVAKALFSYNLFVMEFLQWKVQVDEDE